MAAAAPRFLLLLAGFAALVAACKSSSESPIKKAAIGKGAGETADGGAAAPSDVAPAQTRLPIGVPVELAITPLNGTTFDGPVRDLKISFTGIAALPDAEIEIQTPTNPSTAFTEDNWKTIASTKSAPASSPTKFNDEEPLFRWAVESSSAPSSWTDGGLLRYRAVVVGADGKRRALPYFDKDAGECIEKLKTKSWKEVITSCKSPFSNDLRGNEITPRPRAAALVSISRSPKDEDPPPYLTRRGAIADTDTAIYYDRIGAPTTLDEFKARFGFDADDEATATYYNQADLGVGREMHCRSTNDGGAGPPAGTACYVTNYGVDANGLPAFGGSASNALRDAITRTNQFATVAMWKDAGATGVDFVVFNDIGTRINQAPLDSQGFNTSIPNNCLNCHGGKYETTDLHVNGGAFLPFDPDAFLFSTRPNFTFEAQSEQFRRLNAIVMKSGPPPQVTEMIEGMYAAGGKGGVDKPNTKIDLNWIPPGWNTSAASRTLYKEAYKPFCRTCHVAQFGEGGFTRREDLEGAQLVKVNQGLCQTKEMPIAERPLELFWKSSARGYVSSLLGLEGTCDPAISRF